MATGDATKKAPTKSGDLWKAFMKDVDTELNNIYTQKVAVVKTEAQDMGSFIKSEDTLFTKAVELGGPLPYHKLPNWDQILSVKPGHEGIFYKITLKVLSEPDGKDSTNKVNTASLMKNLEDAFQTSYNGLSKKPNEADTVDDAQEAFVDWIGETIINLDGQISAALQKQLMRGLYGVVFSDGAAVDNKTGDWSSFGLIKGKKGTGIWAAKFSLAIKKIVSNTAQHDKEVHADAVRVITTLKSTQASYNPSTEAAARSWVEATITGMKTDPILDNERKEEVIGALENEITKLFPQPDKSYFYNNFKGILYQNIYEPPTSSIIEQLIVDITEQEAKKKAAEGGGKKNDDEDGKNPKNPIKPIVTPPAKHPSLDGVKGVLDDWFKKYDNGVSKQVKKELEENVSNAIKQALNYSFDGLIEQGSQGALLSATYSRQTITRVVDYVTNLLNDLTNDLFKEIPSNKKESLAAAQNITSAAVAYRQFAESLLSMQEKFNDEPRRNTPNYTQVSALLSSANPSTDKATSIPDIAQQIYNGIGKPEPLVKVAESNGVQVAAFSAGLETSLQRLLQTEQKAALAALKELSGDAEADYTNRLKNFGTDVTNYFTSLDDYISDRQAYEMDLASSELIEQAMVNLSTIASTYPNS